MRNWQRLILISAIITTFGATAMFLPGLIRAGDLEPSGPPGPTMKTLDQIPPTWSQTLPAAERFELVLGDAAVLDKETGLVWMQSPEPAPADWIGSVSSCYSMIFGDRMGWRPPTMEELTSLIDPAQRGPALPSGHPFANVNLGFHWSSTTLATNNNLAWGVSFYDGRVSILDKSTRYFFWCVRGGQGHDAF